MANNNTFSYFYDEAIRRYLVQFMRVFSLIKIRTGPDESGTFTEHNVPIRYGDMSRVVAAIIKENSENTITSTNVMAASILALEIAPERRQLPYHVSQINIDERKFENGAYTSDMGAQYSIQRYMPVPYNLTVQLDIWASNTNVKLQILEQIMTIFNPSIQIQQHENMLDWTIMTDIELIDITWTNRSVPQGTDSDRDVATLKFKMPIWINPPAKVSQKKLIEQIVANVFDVSAIEDSSGKFILDQYTNCFDRLDQIIVTPGNHQVRIGTDGVAYNELVLLSANGQVDEALSWADLFKQYGDFVPGISSIILKTHDNIENESGDVYGTVEFHETNSNTLIFTVNDDTLPEILPSGPVDSIVDPTIKYPGKGLPAADVGQRYLLLADVPVNTGLNPWGTCFGKENDIIEYNGSEWLVSFDSSSESEIVYVKSLATYSHYKFADNTWIYTYFGDFQPGYWRISL